jgi:hypothetical protein
MAQKLLFAISNRKFKLRFWKHTDTCQCNAAAAEGRCGRSGAAAAEDMDLDAEKAEAATKDGPEPTGMDLGDDVMEEAPAAMAAAEAGPAAEYELIFCRQQISTFRH